MYQRLMAVLGVLAIAGSAAACSSDSIGPNSTEASALAKGSGSGGSGGTSDRIEIQLTAPTNSIFPRADGKATFRNRGGEQQLEIEVEDVPRGTVIDFFVGGAKVGTATANSLGNAALRLNSDEGDTVPSVAGKSVEARSGGSPVVSGSF